MIKNVFDFLCSIDQMSEAIRFAIEKRQKLKQELVLQQEDFLINTVSEIQNLSLESVLILADIWLDLIFGLNFNMISFSHVGVEGVAFSEPRTPTCHTGSGLAGAVHCQPITEPISTGKPYSFHSSWRLSQIFMHSFSCYSTKVFS